MSTTTQVLTNGTGAPPANGTPPTTISVTYKETSDMTVTPPQKKYTVAVKPDQVNKDLEMPVRFVNPDGGKVRIVFLSPMGKETDEVQDSQLCNLTVGGFFHFNCYFTPPGATKEFPATTGGTLDVIPHKP
jgi:hypothetical protein